MAAQGSVGFDNGAVFAAHLDRHGDQRAAAVSPEPAVITGEGR